MNEYIMNFSAGHRSLKPMEDLWGDLAEGIWFTLLSLGNDGNQSIEDKRKISGKEYFILIIKYERKVRPGTQNM